VSPLRKKKLLGKKNKKELQAAVLMKFTSYNQEDSPVPKVEKPSQGAPSTKNGRKRFIKTLKTNLKNFKAEDTHLQL